MKKFSILLLIILIDFKTEAQLPTIFAKETADSSSIHIGIIGDIDFNSSALTTRFISKFYTGSYIDQDTKDGVLNRTKNVNRVGADVNYGVFASIKPDSLFHKKGINYFFSIRDREHFDAKYSDDFYKVGFYGNSQYAGRTAYFNDFNLNFIRYQQLQIGIYKAKSDTTINFGIGVSFLKGEQFASIAARKAELYTSADGQYINFNTSMQVAQSDTAHKGIGALNGYGASVDIYLEAPLKTRFRKCKFRFSVSDLGAIRFNKQTLYLNQDSLFHYTGFQIHNINDLKDSTFGHTNKDSLQKSIAPFKKKAFNVTLPATLDVSFETEFNKYFHLKEGVKYIYNANYNILYYVKGNFIINKKFSLNATFGYGGYGNFNYGIGLFANFGKGFMMFAGSNNIEGYVAQKSSSGLGAYISLIKAFK